MLEICYGYYDDDGDGDDDDEDVVVDNYKDLLVLVVVFVAWNYNVR
jgi:hypothetical protein